MSRSVTLLAIAGITVSACTNSTQYVSSWKDPTTRPFHVTHAVAVFMTTDAGMRRMVEDRMAARLPRGVPSYQIIPDSEIKQIEAVRSRLAEGNFDGAVVMRLISEATQPNASAHDFYGYWGYWGSAYNPVYYSTSTYYTVETSLYSIKDNKLVWMGRSQTVDPKNSNKLADFSVNFAVNNMRKDGYLP